MKISTKNKLSLLSIYLFLMISTGLWLEYEVRSSIREMMEATSELIVKEVKSALFEPLADYFTGKSGLKARELRDIVIATTEKSETLELIDVLDPEGTIVTSTDNSHVGQQLNIPTYLFAQDSDPKLISEFKQLNDMGVHTLWSAIVKDGERLGYMRIGMRGHGVSNVFNRIYLTLLICALIGLLALLALDMMLHMQLERITSGLLMLLEAALRGEVDKIPNDRDEFSQVRITASKLGDEIKRAKTKINMTRRELDTVVNHLKVGLMITDSDNMIDLINDRAKLLISPTDDIDDYLQGLDLLIDELKSAIEFLQNNGKLTHTLAFQIEKKEKIKRVNAELYRLDHHEWQGCVVLLHDQDFINALNEDLQSATHLRSLSTLLLGAIHDLKAPINAMSLNLDLLKETFRDQEPDHLKYISVLKNELERLNQLISGLYEQTLGEDKGKTVGDLTSIIDELCLLLRPQAKSQRVNLQFIKPDKPINFFGYPGQIKQAVLNMMLNALEILPKGGDLTVDLSTEVRPDAAVILICDSGPGIPSALQNQIFDMHFTTKATGTGIGLYVSRQIIENHGGEIRVESEYGNGACFEVILPTITKTTEIQS